MTNHVHATSKDGISGQVTISANAARILLDICQLSGDGQSLKSSQSKLQAGMAQQELEAALSKVVGESETSEDAKL